MSVLIIETPDTNVLEFHVSGKLAREDYEKVVPQMEQLIERHGRIRILFEMHDFHGWEAGALWEDMKFDLKHFRDIDRLAIIGETRWERGMAAFCRPFTVAVIHYFEHDHSNQAREWLLAE